MTVGIFGGSFNPPHLGHLIIAETIRDQFELDQILWIPSGRPPHKPGKDLAAAVHRLQMTCLVTENNPFFAVSDMELLRDGYSYTIDTITALKRANKDNDYSLIIGSDSLDEISSWHQPEEIIKRVSILVYKRSKTDRTTGMPPMGTNVCYADAPLIDISGTEIRTRIRLGRSIKYFVPDTVSAYIQAHNLYGEFSP